MKGALSSAIHVVLISKLMDCTDYDLTQTLLFGNTSQTSSNNFKIINALIYDILSSKRFDEPLFKINFFISKFDFNQQFSLFYILPGTLSYIGIWRLCNFVYIYIYIYIIYIYKISVFSNFSEKKKCQIFFTVLHRQKSIITTQI